MQQKAITLSVLGRLKRSNQAAICWVCNVRLLLVLLTYLLVYVTLKYAIDLLFFHNAVPNMEARF